MSQTATDSLNDSASRWEAAYMTFMSSDDEQREFTRKLRQAGADTWPRHSRILELFSGKGSGLATLKGMGFEHVTGLDLSENLLRHAQGTCVCADCRSMPFCDSVFDLVISQDGLHHLPQFPVDLATALDESLRLLRPGGRMVIIEPWLTPRLRAFIWLSKQRAVRRLWPKLDAYGVMRELEYPLYDSWLKNPDAILGLFRSRFQSESEELRPGQLLYVGIRR